MPGGHGNCLGLFHLRFPYDENPDVGTLLSGSSCLEALAWNWGPWDGGRAPDLMNRRPRHCSLGQGGQRRLPPVGSFLSEPQPPLLAYGVYAIGKLEAAHTQPCLHSSGKLGNPGPFLRRLAVHPHLESIPWRHADLCSHPSEWLGFVSDRVRAGGCDGS